MIIGTRKKSILARTLFYLAFLLLLILLFLGVAVRFDILNPLDAFRNTIIIALYGGSALVILSLLALVPVSRNHKVRGTAQLLFTLLIGAALAGPVLYLQKTGGGVPPIHDITTDTRNPPVFTVLQNERTAQENSLDYEGEAVASQQLAAYPHIRPLMTKLAPARAFDMALATARDMGWRIALEDKAGGRIEASDSTMWFRFVDDMVIIVSPQDEGSRIDLRSVSRVGRSDLGANAKRIAAFMTLFGQKSASPAP
ncbi:DUF1499 domain-containing protein [Emcibacter sp.]|uniref:DUF1499 domain-containing protein n=1 Tax=Emcibacter sp. TaxID=1979954 RepID=UPI002AA73356|nr:DUF1499 domain-containing protein [Emcibacter sp.]